MGYEDKPVLGSSIFQPSSIIGCLCRHYYPGLVNIGDDQWEPACSWEHWKRAPDTADRWGREYDNAAKRVVANFWDFFTCAEGMEDEGNEVVEDIVKKRVHDMHYEARVDVVVKYYAQEENRLIPKALAKRVHLTRSMYLKVVPPWCADKLPCYQKIISKWVNPEWRVYHRAASARRGMMGGSVHLQGNLNLPTFVARKRGEGEVPLNTFTGLCDSRKKKNPDPNVEGEQWINPGAGLKIKAYMKKYKEVFGPESDPASQDIDGTVSAMCGQGRKGGRLLVGDGAIPRKEIPTLSHLHATLRSSGPAIERRPQPSMDLLQQFQARLDEEARQRQEAERLRQEAEARSAQMQQAMLDQQQALMQQQEFMAKQQQALQETFARFRSHMDGTGLPKLPILPPLPTFGIIPQSGQGSNNFVVGGSTPGQGSPKTPTAARGPSTSTQQ